MMKKKLFWLYGQTALDVEDALKKGKPIIWDACSIEGRISLKASVEEE